MVARPGFSLVEVVVALVLFSFGLLALQGATLVLLRHARAARDQGLATEVATSRHEQLHWSPCGLPTSGSETVRGIQSRWTDLGAVGPYAKLVTHAVEFGSGPAARVDRYQVAVRCR